MCWVGTLPVALAATSSEALRGAPKMYGKPPAYRFSCLKFFMLWYEMY